jgi:hypothetical protein
MKWKYIITVVIAFVFIIAFLIYNQLYFINLFGLNCSIKLIQDSVMREINFQNYTKVMLFVSKLKSEEKDRCFGDKINECREYVKNNIDENNGVFAKN